MAPGKHPYGVYLGRAQPPTRAHIASLRRGLQVADRIAVLIDGSRLAPSTCGLDLRGGDDAKRAFWVPLAECAGQPERFFEDHMAILEACMELI